jgi:Leucine-rich repeat (LRR) protein
MKYICSFLIVLLICSCPTPRKGKGALPPGHGENDPLTRPETALESNIGANGNEDRNKYSFKLVGDTYWDMNDLTYFLSDTSIKSLRLYKGTFHDLAPLAELTELEELEISSNRHIADISSLGALVNLKKLWLTNIAMEEGIEALSSLVNLRYLNIFYKDRYYRELLPLQNLEILILHQSIHSYLDASYIAQLRSLKELEISSFLVKGSIENIEQLGNLVNLEELNISAVIDLDISWITHLKKLKNVRFEACTLNDVSPLAELPNLVSVSLPRSTVNDITPLLESASIKTLGGNYVEDSDISELIRIFRERGIEFSPFTSDR